MSRIGKNLIESIMEVKELSLDKSFQFTSDHRISFDEKWMSEALVTSLRSNDPKRKVGCVIVTLDNRRIISEGYNGDEPGGTNNRESLKTGKSGFIHAEDNALTFADGSDYSDKKMYVTLSPCKECATRILINGTIKEVIYLEKYCEEGLKKLENNGVKIRKFKLW